ncbi:hypothetical protein A2U01_0093704, partial [Trifolium medium]|nr:hypothetical protein [Trifolium medium]
AAEKFTDGYVVDTFADSRVVIPLCWWG